MKSSLAYCDWLKSIFGNSILETRFADNEITIVTTKENLEKVLKYLRDSTNTQIKILIDITAVDYPQQEKRFDVVYLLLSLRYSFRLKVLVSVDPYEGIPSIHNIYKSANWFEREVWDIFGIFFHNHPDLRRLLTDYGFQGHPLRKDFPLTGFTEVRYDETKKRVVSEPLENSQEFRSFNLETPFSS